MPTYLDRSIAGTGVDILTGTQIVYIAVSLSIIDPAVRIPNPADPDRALRAGWIALGDTLTLFGGGPLFYWLSPIWLDFAQTLWTPDPAGVAGGATTAYGTRLRWSLNGVTAGDVHVFGL